MIDIKQLRANVEAYRAASAAKGITLDFNRILELDQQARALQNEIENLAAQKNETSKKIATANAEDRQTLISAMKEVDLVGEEIKARLKPLADELDELLHQIPNPPAPDVTIDLSEEHNEIIRVVGEKPNFDFPVKDHLEIGKALGIIDMENAAVVSGARFVYLKGDAVRLQLALQQYALTVAAKYNFQPIIVPQLISAEAMGAMGYLEHGGHDEIYFLPKDNLYLIGTSEQAIGPMHGNRIFQPEELPLRYIGISSCYRRESGSYGKDTKGIIRVHQFDKVEMFSFTLPEKSDGEHELLLAIEEELMTGLGLHYHVIKMVSGDLGLPAARKYDIETWIPSQERYRETHSTSTTTDFQTRRLNIRYKNGRKTEFAHALNGTAFAIGRTLVAILENYQNSDGNVTIPEILRPYMGGQTIIQPISK